MKGTYSISIYRIVEEGVLHSNELLSPLIRTEARSKGVFGMVRLCQLPTCVSYSDPGF